MKNFRLTFLFVATAVVVIAAAAVMVNRIIGNLAEANLIRIAEENTARDGLHIHSMMSGHPSTGATADAASMREMQQPMGLTLESAASRLDSSFPTLVEGLNIVKLNLLDLDGNTVWSTDPGTLGVSNRESLLYQKAATGGISSKLAQNHEVVHLDGVRRSVDVVETYLPLRATPSGRIEGVLEIYRDVSSDVAIQVDEAKSAVLWTTVATMGGLLLVLCGFIVVADVRIYRSTRREMALVEDQLTERERSEESLQQYADDLARSNTELRQFAYVASHDLQEPLRMVSSYTQLLARRYKDRLDDDAHEFIAYAVDGALRMQLLISDLLAYSRVGSQGKALEPTDLDPVYDQAVADLAASIEESRASVTHDSLPTVEADGPQLGQLFQNLIGNAIKYRAEEPPRVHVSARRNANDWVFSVADNGIGVETQYAERVFTIFQRLHTREDYPGTGIGLAICKKIVERHGGRIWVESEPGQGSTFFFTMPLNGR